MIQVLGLLDRPEKGSLLVEGRDVLAASGRDRARARNATFGFVFQFYHLVPELDALDNVLLPARIGTGTLEWLSQRGALRARARELLANVGLADRGRHRPSQLSGGERQRVAIARALMNHPSVLFCDEPTGNLDPRTKGGIEDLLFGSVSRDRALLLVTHDEGFARRCQRVLRLEEGRLVAVDDAGERSTATDARHGGGDR
jgi:lipoprotein-releasing system ATP-binding protein